MIPARPGLVCLFDKTLQKCVVAGMFVGGGGGGGVVFVQRLVLWI